MPKIRDIIAAGGVLPALASGVMGKENRGFAAGLLPGFIYKDKYRDDEEERRQAEEEALMQATRGPENMKRGGKVKKMAKGGSASKRADGCAQRGKTRGKMV